MCHLPCSRRPEIAASGTKTFFSSTSCEPEPRIPRTCQVSRIVIPSAFSGTAKCSTVGPPSGSLKTALVTRRSPAGQPLEKILRASIRYPPSVFVAGASALQPVGAAARDEDQVLCRNAFQQPLGRRALITPAPRRRRDEMRVHREGERGRAAARGDATDRGADLGVFGTAAAEFGRDKGLEEALLLEPLVALRHEAVIGIVTRGGLGDLAGDAVGAGEPVDCVGAGFASVDLARVDAGDGGGCHVQSPKRLPPEAAARFLRSR